LAKVSLAILSFRCEAVLMARLARVAVAEVAYHLTQRGNARQYLLDSDAERTVYLDLLRAAVRVEGLSVVGYCLMSNHVHLVVIPHRAEALAGALKSTHGRYASYWNATQASSGHAWQGRCDDARTPAVRWEGKILSRRSNNAPGDGCRHEKEAAPPNPCPTTDNERFASGPDGDGMQRWVGVDTSKRPSTSLGYLTQHGQNKPG
jgi:REP element-mobilizing transposase RayT